MIAPGFVYVLLDGTEPIYVGSTINPKKRIPQHRNKKYTHYVILPCKYYLRLEKALIGLCRPALNKVSKDNKKSKWDFE